MKNLLNTLSESERWHLMVDAAKRGAEAAGYSLKRIPGRGMSNVWNITKDGGTEVASIRTTRDRYIAFPPLDNGTNWRTLGEVDKVIIATVDAKDDPKEVEVYIVPAKEVRSRFDAAYKARVGDGQVVRDKFGVWVGLDRDDRGIAASVGSGIIEGVKPVGVYAISDLVASSEDDHDPEHEGGSEPPSGEDAGPPMPLTVGEVMHWARERIATLAGVRPEAVKLDLKIEY